MIFGGVRKHVYPPAVTEVWKLTPAWGPEEVHPEAQKHFQMQTCFSPVKHILFKIQTLIGTLPPFQGVLSQKNTMGEFASNLSSFFFLSDEL